MGSLDDRGETNENWLQTVFAPDSALSEGFQSYEQRSQQVDMAREVQNALHDEHHLFIEAGTGTGKSLAYLIPLLAYARKQDEPVVVSTHTIHLQEQITEQDIHLANNVFTDGGEVVLAKGRNHYLCGERLQNARGRQENLFPEDEDQEILNRISDWSEETSTGTRDDLPFQVPARIWNQINARRGFCSCLGPQEEGSRKCFYRKNRLRLRSADLVVANHFLVMFDAMMRAREDLEAMFPEYSVLVLDEAHHVERTAQRCLGIEVGYWEVSYLLRELYDPGENTGLLATLEASDLQKETQQLGDHVDRFFASVRRWYDDHSLDNSGTSLRVNTSNFMENTLSPVINEYVDSLRKFVNAESLTPQEEQELTAYRERLEEISDQLDFLVRQEQPEDVYWIQTLSDRDEVVLKHSPISIAPLFQEYILDPKRSVVFTSATLTADPDRPFDYITSRLGADEARTRELGDPFQYDEQVLLRIPKDMPHPGREGERYIDGVQFYTEKYIRQTHGNAFVLFTSYRMMQQVYEGIHEQLEEDEMPCFSQGGDTSRAQLIEAFKNRESAVIFGVSSFWEGVDISGDDLQNVIITKLPFPVPTEPINEAVSEYLEEQGRNAFSEFALPRAILRLRQGFGRLIRRRSDQGQVCILDSRVVRKSYGDQFLEALPDCRLRYDRAAELQ